MSLTTHPLTLRLANWIAREPPASQREVLLDRRRVYILPTRAGLAFGLVLLALLIGAINYELQLGFLLTFLVAGVAIAGMHHTHRNLARLTLRAHHAENVFAGDAASFHLAIANPTREARYALENSPVPPRRRWRRVAEAAPTRVDVPAEGNVVAIVAVPTTRRGALPAPRLRIVTRCPFGLWQAWSYMQPALAAVVYPAPEQDAPPLPAALEGEIADGGATVAGGVEWAAIRPDQAGDAPRAISWRLAARSDQLAVKMYETAAGAEPLFDYRALPAPLDPENKLARLTRWVLMAEAAQLRYGLRLPGGTIGPDTGALHRERCLTALALFQE
ncbi:MAG: DUF58 domain-containing protein [Betaproteobacteria bacterium]